jgi:hypothetical protein
MCVASKEYTVFVSAVNEHEKQRTWKILIKVHLSDLLIAILMCGMQIC